MLSFLCMGFIFPVEWPTQWIQILSLSSRSDVDIQNFFQWYKHEVVLCLKITIFLSQHAYCHTAIFLARILHTYINPAGVTWAWSETLHTHAHQPPKQSTNNGKNSDIPKPKKKNNFRCRCAKMVSSVNGATVKKPRCLQKIFKQVLVKGFTVVASLFNMNW